MLNLKAEIRDKFGRQAKTLKREGFLPAILYGPEIKNLPLKIDEKEFEKVYGEAGESSMINLKVKTQKSKVNEVPVLIKEISRDPLSGKYLHVDFYHPSIRKEVEAEIPLVFEGEPKACKELGGTLVKEIQQVQVKGLAQNLPREIRVDVGWLKTFEDRILIGDLKVPEGVKILRESDEVVANVVPPAKEEKEEVAAEEAKKPTEEEAEEGKVNEEKKTEKAEKKEE